MKLHIVSFANLLMLTCTLNLFATPPQEATGTTRVKTPMLDRQLFFGNPQISGGQLSPNGKFISFMKAYNGIMNVWVKEFAEPFDRARPLTDSPRPLYGYSWTDDGKYILYVKDSDGDENMNIFAVDPNAALPEGKCARRRKKQETAFHLGLW